MLYLSKKKAVFLEQQENMVAGSKLYGWLKDSISYLENIYKNPLQIEGLDWFLDWHLYCMIS